MTNYEACQHASGHGMTINSLLMQRFSINEAYRKDTADCLLLWSDWLVSQADTAFYVANIGDLVKRKNSSNIFGVVQGYFRRRSASTSPFTELVVRWPNSSSPSIVETSDVEIFKLPEEAVDAILSARSKEVK